MKCIVLAAGYATRLYPLTKNTAKPLLKVGEKYILDHIIEKVERVDVIDEVFVITNDKFYADFAKWALGYTGGKSIKVMNDQTTTNDNRLGAIADIQYVIDQVNLDDDLLVLAGDNLFNFELTDFVEFYEHAGADCITAHKLDDIEEIKRTGVIELGDHHIVTSFEEKPKHPKSNLAVPPFYIYERETIPLIKRYLLEGENPDAPGNFIPWLIKHKNVYAYEFRGERFDIGTVESYEKVCEKFSVLSEERTSKR